jgi:hypothetical protein
MLTAYLKFRIDPAGKSLVRVLSTEIDKGISLAAVGNRNNNAFNVTCFILRPADLEENVEDYKNPR